MRKLSRSSRTLAAATIALSIAATNTALADGHALTAPFGEGDQAGASNLMTPEKVKEAMELMKTCLLYTSPSPRD